MEERGGERVIEGKGEKEREGGRTVEGERWGVGREESGDSGDSKTGASRADM